jgi:hypothetical protein
LERARKTGFEEGLETPGLGSMPDDQFDKLVSAIQKQALIPEVSKGQAGVKYDVILQPGHYGRPPGGPLGTSGQLVSERALAAYITNIIAQSLRQSKNKVLVISADNYIHASRDGAGDGLKTRIFLAIHFEGSKNKCSAKPSLGYRKNTSPWGMHAVGMSLASAMGYTYPDFEKDNYTANEVGYYMFRQLNADLVTGILEVGELTCPEKEKELIARSNLIGENIAYALNSLLKTPTYSDAK